MIPTTLRGDRLPALAPFATDTATRKAGRPRRAAIGAARGATRATEDTAPGPTADTVPASRKSSQGTSRRSPPTRPTARSARRARVPFDSAAANNKATPGGGRKRDAGNAEAGASDSAPGVNGP